MLVWILNNLFQRIIKFNNLLLISHGNSNNYPKFKRFNWVKQVVNRLLIQKIMIPQSLENPKILFKVKYLIRQFLKIHKTQFNTKQTIHLWMFFKLIRTKISKKMMGSVPSISLKMMVLRILRLNLTNKKKSLVTLLTFNKQNNNLHQHHKVSQPRTSYNK